MSPTPSPSGDTTATAGCTKTPVYWKSRAVEIGRSGSEGRLRSVPSKAIVAEPPLSSAIPVTAPSRTSAWASSKFVIPIEYPGWRPSTVTRIILPSASWPTALRGARGPSWLVVKISPALKIGAPSRTICGPPPIAETMSGQSGLRLSWVVTICPTGASAVRRRGGRADGDENGATGRDRHRSAAGAELDDRSLEVGVRGRGREREQDRRDRAGLRRRGRPPHLRVERDAVALERLVELVQGALAAEPLPGAARA